METKKYNFSLVLGRLNHIHIGHEMLINESIKVSKETLVLLGSAQEEGTLRNPFKFDTRKRLVEKIYNDDSIIVLGLNDMSHEHDISFKWGRYILDNVYSLTGKRPDLFVYGNDESRQGWFSDEDKKGIDEMIISRDIIKISATNLRGLILIGKKDEWVKYVSKNIHDEFDALREELLNISVYKEIYDKIKDELTLEKFLEVYKVYEKIDKENKLNKNRK